MGDVMDELTGVNNLGEKMGAVSYLSPGQLDLLGILSSVF